MADIQTARINAVYTKIICERSIERELSDYFTFYPPNTEFKRRGRFKGWDGSVKLFNLRTKYLYSGLLRYLYTFARERGYTIGYDPDLLSMNNFSLVEAMDYIKSLKISSRGASLVARDYQEIAFAKAIRYKRLMLISPTSSGKSFIIYTVMRYLLEHDCKRGLLVVPTKSLVEQMYSDFRDYSSLNHWEVDRYCQRVYEGFSPVLAPESKLLISTWQSIYDLPEEWFAEFDFVIGDEAHTFAANCVGKVMHKTINANYRLATTGTSTDETVKDLKIEGYFGPMTKTITTKEMMDRGFAATLSIKSIVLKHPPGTRAKLAPAENAQGAFTAEIDYIVGCVSRNRFIRNLALSIHGNTLLLFQYVDRHGRVLHKMIEEKLNASERKCFFVYGGTDVEDREAVRAITEKERDAIIVASIAVFGTGINIRNLHNIIFASPTKSRIRTLQSIGRGLRLGDGEEGKKATLFDIADDMREPGHQQANFTLRHYAERMLMYANEKFQVSHYPVDLKS